MAHILVVEDDAAIRTIVTDFLTEEGYQVRQAANGAQALSSIAAEVPELMLLDLSLPVLTGWNVVSTLQQIAVRVPIVIMTARHDSANQAHALDVDGYLAKPFDLTALLDTVRRFHGTTPQAGEPR